MSSSRTTLRRRSSIDMVSRRDSIGSLTEDGEGEHDSRPKRKMQRRSTLDTMKADLDSFRNDMTSVVQQNQGTTMCKKVNSTSHRRVYSILIYSLFGVSCLFAISFFFKDPLLHDDASAVPSNHRQLKRSHDRKHGDKSTPCPYLQGFADFLRSDDAKEDPVSLLPKDHPKRKLTLLNEGKGCWGHCDMKAGDCDYCGSGQCCRKSDYANGVEGCELASDVVGAKCGNWKGEAEVGLRNEGKACRGKCNNQSGDCDYCGTGQCCRKVDGERGVEGCELTSKANWVDGPASQCGAFAPVLLNEGKGCFGHCDSKPGDCDYCGDGQCCRNSDYINGVEGCELAEGVVGAKCGLWKGQLEEGLRNEGRSCWGNCDGAGNCDFCGTGQCCRIIDGERCVPGCELASLNWLDDGPGSQCGDFLDPESSCTNNEDSTNNEGEDEEEDADAEENTNTEDEDSSSTDESTSELLNEGMNCGGPNQCNISGGARPGDCAYCGSGQCCNFQDWRRGVPGCELAENVVGTSVCGAFKQPRPEPDDFRIGGPRELYHTPGNEDATERGNKWIKDIVATGDLDEDNEVPAYTGDGGEPWSQFEMALVRDALTAEMRRASTGRDELSASKFIRLPFHDCLLYDDGTGGCDGCINWENVGFRYEGRVESRNFEDDERAMTNNGLGDVVNFLEWIYTLDFGKTWASGCWTKPGSIVGAQASIANTRTNPFTVSSIDECRDICLNTTDCRYFTVPHMPFVDSTGPCRLFSDQGTIRQTGGNGRLIAGDAYCPSKSWSLQSTGKSRADLWAFASLVAIEEGIQRHNYACDGDRRSPHNGPIMCTQFEGEEQCSIDMNVHKPFIFKTGRKDCDTSLQPSYKTGKKEDLPDDHFNGTMTVRYMEDHFQFSAKETVTIMGAHTVGTFHQRQTGHKYVWTSDFQAFNNQFYRNIAGKEDWFFDDDECTKVGDAWGNKGPAVWIAKMNQVFRSGGPIQWIQKKVVCPNCAARSYERGGRHPERLSQDRSCCLEDVPEGAQCRPDNWDPSMTSMNGSKVTDRDDDFSDGCEYSHFIFGTDEAALGSDMGLMYKFDVDVRGFPSGCSGLHTFYPSGNRFSDWTCGIDGRPWFTNPELSWNDPALERQTVNEWTEVGCPAGCDRNDYKYPDDPLTLADHVERYADDQDAWIHDFIPVMEKMISNGYDDNDLVISFSG